MAELDAFEARFARALRRYETEISTDADPWSIAQTAAQAHQPQIFWPLHLWPARVLVWILLAALLLAAMVASALFIGAMRAPVGAACPPGSKPDVAGPADQARPPWVYFQPMAFDGDARRIVAHAGETWTFDVCTNTWAAMHPAVEAPAAYTPLVYDADSDLTLAMSDGRVWAYDLAANTWVAKGTTPALGDFPHMVYDSESGLVSVLTMPPVNEPLDLWTYNVDTDSWTQLDMTGAPVAHKRPIVAYEPVADRLLVYDGEMQGSWLVDPHTGQWTPSSSRTPTIGYDWAATGGEIAYDASARQIVVLSGGEVVTYDAAADRWEVSRDDQHADGGCRGPTCIGRPSIVYDSLNRRLVTYGSEYPIGDGNWVQGSAVLAFDPTTISWTTLLAGPSPIPTLNPAEQGGAP